MIFSGWKPFPATVLDADLNPMGEGRPSGLHLSQIIGSMRLGLGEPMYPENEAAKVRFIEGFMWEVALEYVQAGMPLDAALGLAFKRHMTAVRSGIAKQIKLIKDGVHMTPDGYNDSDGVMESYKATRKSYNKAREFEQNFWGWILQESCYCWAKGVDTARWIVLFINGDYKKTEDDGTFGPRMVEGTATWEPEELAYNWQLVMDHARKRGMKE